MIFEMPQIPFDVYDYKYNKTIHVVSSCVHSNDSILITFDSKDVAISGRVKEKIKFVFDAPGIKKIKICRIDSLENSI